MSRKWSWVLEWGLGLGLMGIILWRGDLGDLHQLLGADPWWVLLILVSTLGIAHLYSAKWRAAMIAVGEEKPPSWKLLYHYFFLARYTGLVAPMSVSDASVRIVALRYSHGMSLTRATFSVYLERAFDLIAVLVCVVPSVAMVTGAITPLQALAATAILAVVGGALFVWKPMVAPLVLERLFLAARNLAVRFRWLHRLMKKQDPPEELHSLQVEHGKAFLIYSMSLIGVFAMSLRFYFVFRAVHAHVGFLPLLLVAPVGMLATVLAVTPGGLGILDAGWYGILALIHIPSSQIVLGLVASRAILIVITVACYGASWAWTRAERRAL